MKKPVLGDVFEIRTPHGLGYLQYVRNDPNHGELIRVLRPILAVRPVQFDILASEKERFITYFPLSAAHAKQIVKRVANEPIPDEFRTQPIMRSPGKIDPERRVVESWWIIDRDREYLVTSLTEEQKHLPIDGIINDTLLIELLMTDWRPSDYT